ncbi:hypothetical protein MRY87_08300 [bacterium]|nr:hypothetical protein [bacterium]
MEIGSGALRSLFRGRGRSTEELLEEASRRREQRRGGGSERAEERREARDARRAQREERASSPPNSTPVSPPESESVTSSPPVAPAPSESDALSLDDLAELYVKQYESGAGVRLSDEAFEAKKNEVAQFYAQMSGGEERLDAIVFANDTEG